MKKLLAVTILSFAGSLSQAQNGMGIGNNNPQELLDVSGAIRIGGTVVGVPDAGSIRWNGTNFQGYNGSVWVDLDDSGNSNTLDQAYNEGGAGAGRQIDASDGAVRINGTDGLIVTGTFGTGAGIEATGAGTRMFFNPRKAAFRAGMVNGTEWDDANVGLRSIAFGENTIASGPYSTSMGRSSIASGWESTAIGTSTAIGNNSIAMGYYSTANQLQSTAIGSQSLADGLASSAFGRLVEANGDYSTAIGVESDAIGDYSIALGIDSKANGDYSTAFGESTNANGQNSTTIGKGTKAESFIETTIGQYNSNYTPNSVTTWDSADRLFGVGNGTANFNRSDAFVILKDGNVGIGTSTPTQLLELSGISGVDGLKFPDGTVQTTAASTTTGNTLESAYNQGGSGNGRQIEASSGAVRINGEDGFIVTGTYGSGDNIEVTGPGSRMFFNPNHVAFRVGNVNGSQWDVANLGDYSTAFGRSTTASGFVSTAMGEQAVASGNYSFSLGYQTIARSYNEVVIGFYNTDYTPLSTVSPFGLDRLFTIGNGNVSNRGDAMVVLKDGSVGIGTSTPSAVLDIEGTFQLVDGNEGVGKVLTSDGTGNASWQTATADGDGDASNELQTLSQTGNSITLSNGGGTVSVADSDNDASNEFQSLSQTGTNVTLSNGGGTISVADNDNNASNEIQTMSVSGSTLSLSNGGGSVNLPADGDGDASNELQTLSQTGISVTLSNGGGTISVADSDNDASNEFQTLSQTGTNVTLSDGGGTISVADNDNDASNEIQALSISGSTVSLSNGGGSVNLPAVTGNTLDLAYDQGGAGLGRQIDASDGALRVNGDDGFIVTGTYASGDPVEVSGAGTRMFFNPNKAAFRAGTVDGAQWNDANIGSGSVAIGPHTLATNYGSVSIGYETQSTDSASVALGYKTIATGGASFAVNDGANASGDISFASGFDTQASGLVSTAMGVNTVASGDGSFAMGNWSTAESFLETVIGSYNTDYTPTDANGWDNSDRLFVVGNGPDPGNRSDAMVILKSGAVGFGTSTPATTVDISGWLRYQNGSQGFGKLLGCTADGTATWVDVEIPPSTIPLWNSETGTG